MRPALALTQKLPGSAAKVIHMETSLPRLRGLAISPRTFRWLAGASAVLLLLIVASGATVRLTSSGLGCPKWPGCEGALQLPAKGYHHRI